MLRFWAPLVKKGAQLFEGPYSAVRVWEYACSFQSSASFDVPVSVRSSDCSIFSKFRSKMNIQNEVFKLWNLKISKMAKSGGSGRPWWRRAPKFSGVPTDKFADECLSRSLHNWSSFTTRYSARLSEVAVARYKAPNRESDESLEQRSRSKTQKKWKIN